MSTFKRPPIKNRFVDNPVPKEYIDVENNGKMFSMISQGDFGAFRDFLLESKININILYEGMTIITEIIKTDKASENKKLELLTFLGNKIYVNTSDDNGFTPLHYAVKFGYEKIVNYLIERKANITTTANNGLTPLHYATLISLKDCPKENMPQELIEFDKTTKAKTSDITEKMIDIFLADGDNIKFGNNDVEIKTQFMTDIEGVKALYKRLIEELVTDEKINEKLTSLFEKNNVDKKEIIESFTKGIISEIKTKLKFPEKTADIVEELLDYGDNTNFEQLYDETINNIVESLKEYVQSFLSDGDIGGTIKSTEDYYKRMEQEHGSKVSTLMNEHDIKFGTNIEYIRQSLANKNNMKTTYMPERHSSVNGDDNERILNMIAKDIKFNDTIDTINVYVNEPYDIADMLVDNDGNPLSNPISIITYNGDEETNDKLTNYDAITIDELNKFVQSFTDLLTFDNMFTYERMLNPYSTELELVKKTLQTYFYWSEDTYKINNDKVDDTVFNLKIINSMLEHYDINNNNDKSNIIYNLNKSKLSLLFSQSLKHNINYNDTTLPAVIEFKYDDEMAGKPFSTVTENEVSESLEKLHIALRYPDKVGQKIIDYINKTFGTETMLKIMMMRVLAHHNINNKQLVLNSNQPYQAFLSLIEKACYDETLYHFTRPIIADNYDLNNFEQSLLTRIYRYEGFREDPRSFIILGNGGNNIDNFAKQLIQNRKTDYHSWFIDSIETYWKMQYNKDDNANSDLTEYDTMNSNFTRDYNTIKDVEVVKDILSTFYAFVITMFKRYLIDNIHYGPRSQLNGADYTNKDLFNMIVTMMKKYDFEYDNRFMGDIKNLSNINDYIVEYDKYFYDYNNRTSNIFTNPLPGGVGIPLINIPQLPKHANLNITTYDAMRGLIYDIGANPPNILLIDNERNLIRGYNYLNLVNTHMTNNIAMPTNNWNNAGTWNLSAVGIIQQHKDNMNIFINSIINNGIKYVYSINSTNYTEDIIRDTLKRNISRTFFNTSYNSIIDYAKYPLPPPYIPTMKIGNDNVVLPNAEPNPTLQTLQWNAVIGRGIPVLNQAQIDKFDKEIDKYNKEIDKYNKNVDEFNENYISTNYVKYVFEAMRTKMKSDIILKINDVTGIEYIPLFNGTNVMVSNGIGIPVYNAVPVESDDAIDIPDFYTSLFNIRQKQGTTYDFDVNNNVKIPQMSDMVTIDYDNLDNGQYNLLITVNPQPNNMRLYNMILAILLSLKNQIHYLYEQNVTSSNINSFRNHYNAYHQLSLLAKLYSLMSQTKSPQYLSLLHEHVTNVRNIIPNVITTLDQTRQNLYMTEIENIIIMKQNKLKDIYNIVEHYNNQYQTFISESNNMTNILSKVKIMIDRLLFADNVNNLMYRDELSDVVERIDGKYYINDVEIELKTNYFNNLSKFAIMHNENVVNDDMITEITNLQENKDINDFYKNISDNYSEHVESVSEKITEQLHIALKELYKSHYVYYTDTDINYGNFPSTSLSDEPWKIEDILENNDIIDIVHYLHNKPSNYKLLNSVVDQFPEIDLIDDRKENILNDHMKNIYKQFVTTFMNNYIYNTSVEQIKGIYDNKVINISIDKIILEPNDYRVNINSIKSKLKDYLTTGKAPNFNSHENVKLIEDEDYDIYAIVDDKIRENGKTTYVFYSYDYYNKQDTMKCIELNTNIISNLIKKGANIHASDMNGKTIIDYMIEARMSYLLDDDIIKKSCSKHENIVTMSKYEQKHNMLFSTLIENHQTDFIRRIKLLETIKQNIPINLRYIFMVYTVLQNMNWYRLMNKGNFDNPNYNKYVSYNNDVLTSDYNWKLLFEKVIVVDKTSRNEKEKINKRMSKKRGPQLSIKDDEDSDTIDEKQITDTDIFGNVTYSKIDISDNKVIDYINKFAKQYDDIPTNYTHIWKEINNDVLDKPYIIHSVLSKEYDEALQYLEIVNSSSGILADNKVTYDIEKIARLKTICTKLDDINKPMITNIDERILPKIYNENELFKFQIQVYVHILSTFLGSHIYMTFKRILDLAISKISREVVQESMLDEILEPLKLYVLSTDCKAGNLSYDFVRAHLNFQVDEGEYVEPKKTSEMFAGLTLKFTSLDKYGLNDSKLINKINISVSAYYLSLYQESLNALLNFSDGYLRFVKNQSLGIKFISKLE